ncbi:septation protein A [Sulfuriferula nivalis]|uniref:Inner membrane-spanning protein YciB n=1 Tax=Sulfuriferula nivalis TaxID=2675298 RepID=A0A809RGN0_9PROT|nr:septation protein A [Sulfuriferula nivalis]BBP01029.1 putative intracellular septation protein A [Sulfuriferula nivalis]
MKFLFDFFPILLFFVAYKFGDIIAATEVGKAAILFFHITPPYPIYVATSVGMIAGLSQIAWLIIRGKKIDTMMWISVGSIMLLGGATLLLHDETFIKWKPTALYWTFALGLLISAYGFKKNVIRTMMGEQLDLPAGLWTKLNLSWVGFFIIMGLVNLYVAFTYSTDAWVNFKLFGSTAMMFAFILAQGYVLSKYIDDKKE